MTVAKRLGAALLGSVLFRGLAMTVIGMGLALNLQAGEGGDDGLRKFVERYYAAVAANDEPAMAAMFSADALFKFNFDFGAFYPDYEVEFRADDEGAFDESMFEGYEVSDTRFKIEKVEVSADGGVVEARLEQKYRWDDDDGTMKARERLQLKKQGGAWVIVELESQQQYR